MDEKIANSLPDHAKALRRYAMALVGNPSEADDLVQECLYRALVYIEKGSEIRNMRAYLFTILHNVRVDRLSAQKRRGPVKEFDETASSVMQMPTQHTHMECRELDRLLQCLPSEQLEVVLLVGLEGFAYQDVADTLEIPIGTVMSRLSRGRKALRHLMAGDAGESGMPRERGRKANVG